MRLAERAWLARLQTRRPLTRLACPRCLPCGVRTLSRSYAKDSERQSSDYSNEEDRDLILSILKAGPSKRDTKTYIESFSTPQAPGHQDLSSKAGKGKRPGTPASSSQLAAPGETPSKASATSQQDLNAISEMVHSSSSNKTALVKLQGPFADDELRQVAKGVRHLGRLGLSCVLMIDPKAILAEGAWPAEPDRTRYQRRHRITEEVNRTAAVFEHQGIAVRPLAYDVFKTRKSADRETHIIADMAAIRSAMSTGKTPILGPLAVDQELTFIELGADESILSLVEAMVAFDTSQKDRSAPLQESMPDLSPHRIMIVNQEGGIPSVAREGFPHLNINLATEYEPIIKTFRKEWQLEFPTSLSNLTLLNSCLSRLPRSSSGCIVSHRSPASLVANLITNKPVVSSSLPYRALTDARNLGGVTTPAHMPTLIRAGINITALPRCTDIDRAKLERLLEQSFGKKLKAGYWEKLQANLLVAIIAGDYEGAAILTREGHDAPGGPITYLDKFAVLPGRQGDGVADFLWGEILDRCMAFDPVAVASLDCLISNDLTRRDRQSQAKNLRERLVHESGYGSGLIWRSRTTNPVNRWYFERADGHIRLYDEDGQKGKWTFFWVGGAGTGRNIGKIDGPRFDACKRVVRDIEPSFS